MRGGEGGVRCLNAAPYPTPVDCAWGGNLTSDQQGEGHDRHAVVHSQGHGSEGHPT